MDTMPAPISAAAFSLRIRPVATPMSVMATTSSDAVEMYRIKGSRSLLPRSELRA